MFQDQKYTIIVFYTFQDQYSKHIFIYIFQDQEPPNLILTVQNLIFTLNRNII